METHFHPGEPLRTLDNTVQDLRRSESTFLSGCGLTVQTAWNTCRQDAMEFCAGEAFERCQYMRNGQ